MLHLVKSKLFQFLIISSSWILYLSNPNDAKTSAVSDQFEAKLKMVNVVSRHGNRGPESHFPELDKTADVIKQLWPNGMGNLTEMGRFRQYSLGLKLRQLYQDYLGMSPDEVLALSSTEPRCIESLQKTLDGLFDIQFSNRWGLNQIRLARSCKKIGGCLSNSGTGMANQWKSINISTTIVPSLDWRFLHQNCPWKLKNTPSKQIDPGHDKDIAALPGINQLKRLIKSHYNLEFNFAGLTKVYSTILNELEIAAVNDTFHYSSHFLDWFDKPTSSKQPKIRMFDVLEEVFLLISRNEASTRENKIQTGPILTSIVDSFSLALNNPAQELHEPTSIENYKNKKMILYSTHDIIVTDLLNSLNLINFDGPFERRFIKFCEKSDLKQYLNGIAWPAYGISVRFELFELESKLSGEKFPVVRASLYNNKDIKFSEIHYHKMQLGKACQRLFKKAHPKGHLSRYYKPSSFHIDKDYVCPFELFKNVTSPLMVSLQEAKQLCQLKNG